MGKAILKVESFTPDSPILLEWQGLRQFIGATLGCEYSVSEEMTLSSVAKTARMARPGCRKSRGFNTAALYTLSTERFRASAISFCFGSSGHRPARAEARRGGHSKPDEH